MKELSEKDELLPALQVIFFCFQKGTQLKRQTLIYFLSFKGGRLLERGRFI